MVSGRKIGFTLLLLSILSCCWLNASARVLICQGPYKAQRLTQAALKPIIAAHQRWLKTGAKASQKGRANFCGADLHGLNLSGVNLSYADLMGADLSEANLQAINLSHAILYKTYFRQSEMRQANLQSADLEAATLEAAKLQDANLRLAHLMKANLSKANLSSADLRSANLTSADLSDAILRNADLSWANLTQSNLSHANLNQANLTEAVLIDSDLSHTTLKDANFSQADLKNALFQPLLTNLPNLVSLATSKNFRTIQFPNVEGTAALIELRSAYKKIGVRTMERSITAMVKMKQMKQAWNQGGWGYLESVFSYVFFYLPSDFGAMPGRALFAFLLFVFLFTIPYYLSLLIHIKGSGIAVIWRAHEKLYELETTQNVKESKKLRKTLRKHSVFGWKKHCREHLRLARIALYFSFVSASSIGWRELNVSSWILHLQKRDYQLKGFGWVRVLAGSQSLISAYLIVLWVLTYFGRPFEW